MKAWTKAIWEEASSLNNSYRNNGKTPTGSIQQPLTDNKTTTNNTLNTNWKKEVIIFFKMAYISEILAPVTNNTYWVTEGKIKVYYTKGI